MPTSQGFQKLYCTESPEVWFEDIGHGQLVNGIVTISLDALFLETVTINDQNKLTVFIQEEDFTNGLIVKPGKTSFTVIEKGNGTSNAAFSYRIIAKRKFYQDVRFGNEAMMGNTVDWSKYHDVKAPVDYSEARKLLGVDEREAKDKAAKEALKGTVPAEYARTTKVIEQSSHPQVTTGPVAIPQYSAETLPEYKAPASEPKPVEPKTNSNIPKEKETTSPIQQPVKPQ